MRSVTVLKLALAALVLAAVVVVIRLQIPILTPLVKVGLLAVFLLLLAWLLWKGLQRFLAGRTTTCLLVLPDWAAADPDGAADAVDLRLPFERLLPGPSLP